MEALRLEQDKLDKKGNLSRTIEDVQKTIDLLVAARATIAADGTSGAPTLAKLKRPIKASLDQVNSDIKDIYSAHKDYSKALDKKFKPQSMPASHNDALSSQPALINRAIAMHLLREGQFNVAQTFISEANAKPHSATSNGSNTKDAHGWDSLMQDADGTPLYDINGDSAGALQSRFAHMYLVLDALRKNHDLNPAIEWARQHSYQLELRGSNLEFDLCRLRFVELYSQYDPNDHMSGPLKALEYARQTFPNFSARYMRETSSLLGSLAFAPALTSSPYKSVFFNNDAWEHAASSFIREFCAMLGLSEKSPLYTAATAGAIALPVLEKLERVMGEVGGQWTSVNELPVEIPLPHSYLFHSIFVCPVSKEQGTDTNPPMMLPCGHIIAKESLEKISRGNKFKCPYCPVEGHPKEARKVFL
ncbi:RMND5A protein [Aureobasidium subglaciale]|nr:RMND5A protein [Aureobasidium subglaciale]